MYLKCIEINGFKSFANKMLFEFPHGITGIVGPNGSGKSNIGDAVRWVLGEQSAKQLRGSKMEDVIFSGTQSRKPMGYAYVAITFDNSDRRLSMDYDEIKVARRVYRSGESEYLINGSVCRRRDIVSLFYDTGIGKDGYSIIGQGQVEKILSGKIEDSRELFDEAAGIAKYKKNRSVTEKSLEQERQNLERVTDVLSELEKRVGPLESQSKKAKEFLKLRDREKELDLSLFLYDHNQLTREQEELHRQHRIVSGDLDETSKKCQDIREKNTSMQEELDQLAKQEEALLAEERSLSEDKSAKEQEALHLSHEIESNDRMIEHFQSLEVQSKKDQEDKQDSLKLIWKNLELEAGSQMELRKEEEALAEKSEALAKEKASIEAEINIEQEKMNSLLNTSFDTKEKMGRFDAMEEQLHIRNAEYNSRLIALNSELRSYISQAESVEKELASGHTSYEEALKVYEAAKARRESLGEQKRQVRHTLEASNQDYIRQRSRYEAMSQMAEHYDGYNQSIKHIMEQKKNNPGIIGVVADILTLDKKYETAIEIALGGALQNVVTENEQIAKQMIAFLKKNRLGRATFLPLTSIRNRNNSMHPGILEDIGVIGVASDLVKVDAKFTNLVKSLLGKTIVVDNIDHAMLLARKNNFSLRIVTIEGDLLNPGGSMTGGAFRRAGNLLGRKRELDESKALIAKAQKAYKEAEKELETLNQSLLKMEKQEEEEKNRVDSLSLSLHDLKTKLPGLFDKRNELEASIKTLHSDHAILKEQLNSIRSQKESLVSEQVDTEKTHEENSDRLEQLNQMLGELAEKMAAYEQKRNEVKLKLATSSQQITFYNNEVERIQNEILLLAEGQKKDAREQEGLKQQNLLSLRKKKQLEGQLAELTMQWEELAGKMEAVKESQRQLQKKKNAIFHDLEEQSEKLRILEKEEGRISSRLERIASDLESKQNYMWDTYEITYNNALATITELPKAGEIAEFRMEKKDLQREIKALGHVNVNAIEEYKEVGERYEFLREQYDDIKVAEEKLVGMIDELNEAMREQFKEKFKEIREMFTRVFQNLFEGGTASLELMDEQDILECGIRIIAQPPGKKLQNIMLLSGGERALTAIALLFAIQNLKPSPFCLLDEIEAALDDANIVRFSKYLKKLARDTQFIVITHRRGTMNASDALYGITMQEKGVSTIVSVDLIDSEIS